MAVGCTFHKPPSPLAPFTLGWKVFSPKVKAGLSSPLLAQSPSSLSPPKLPIPFRPFFSLLAFPTQGTSLLIVLSHVLTSQFVELTFREEVDLLYVERD